VIDMSAKAASKALGALERRGYDCPWKAVRRHQQSSPSRSSKAKIGRLNAVSSARIMWQAASRKSDRPLAA
jgi:hypothetical protein